jgi:1,2-phenylacetyl-CoA epoxidase catalytic subunit
VTTFRSAKDLPQDYKHLLSQVLRIQGYCEMVTANMLGHALKFIPELYYKIAAAQQIEDELERFTQIARIYRDVAEGKDLFDDPDSRLVNIPYAENWFELAVVQFLFDRSCEFHLREYQNCSYEPYGNLVKALLREDKLNGGFGEKVLKDYCKYPTNRGEAQRIFDDWFPIAMQNLGHMDPTREMFAIKNGMITRDCGAVMADFISEIKPAMRECGLNFRMLDGLETPLPADLDLTI